MIKKAPKAYKNASPLKGIDETDDTIMIKLFVGADADIGSIILIVAV